MEVSALRLAQNTVGVLATYLENTEKIMKIVNSVLIIVMYVCLFVFLLIKIVDIIIYLELSSIKISEKSLIYSSNMAFGAVISIYILLLMSSYIQLLNENRLNNIEISFWKKILLMKPFSGIAAYYLCICSSAISKNYILPLVKITYNLRNISLYIVIVSLLSMFFMKTPNMFFMIFFFSGIYLALFFHLIFEPLIITHAWGKGKTEWEKLNYYHYFASVKSIFGYKEYYKKILHSG